MELQKRVAIELTGQEALVLWAFLFRFSDESVELPFADPAEQRVLWTLETRIQPHLTQIILGNPNYVEDLAKAQKAVRDAFPD